MMKLSDLLGTPVTSQSGERHGHLHDLRAELAPGSLTITGLVVGGLGALERLGIGAPKTATRIRTHDVIPWEKVIRADTRGVIVQDDTSLQ